MNIFSFKPTQGIISEFFPYKTSVSRQIQRREFYFIIKFLIICQFFGFLSLFQVQAQQDSVKVVIATVSADSLASDSTKVIEDAALDIAQNRGIFIVSPDSRIQLRIIGSVRYLAVYDNRNLLDKNNFLTFQIPFDEEGLRNPNIYNGLDQTRLGFEITRTTGSGNLFVRLEMDFSGPKSFRIRHAYGQFSSLLFGQTWSLFSHVTNVPATVDFNSPTGSSGVLTPQFRYSKPRLFRNWDFAASLEYSIPDVSLPDTLAIESVQIIPDVAMRLNKSFNWGKLQFTGLITLLSGKNDSDDLLSANGWGIAASSMMNSWAKGKWYFQVNGGRGITRYLNDMSQQGFDLIVNPFSGEGVLPFAIGSFITYEYAWNEKTFSNFSYGISYLEKQSFAPEVAYRWGDTFRVNTFYSVIDGAQFGLEWILGDRRNINGSGGRATRFNFLVYYDF